MARKHIMADSKQRRVVLLPVDNSEHSERAFNCRFLAVIAQSVQVKAQSLLSALIQYSATFLRFTYHTVCGRFCIDREMVSASSESMSVKVPFCTDILVDG